MWKVIFGICLTLFPGFWGFSHSIVFTRRILAQPTNATNALEVAKQVAAANIRDDKPVVEALRVCAACQQPQVALEIFQLFPDREQCRTMAISVMGACEKLDVALRLLEDATNIGPYNAAIAAARKAKDWEKALEIYNMTVERGITAGITVNALLTILAQRRQGKVALEILSTMPCKADRLSYQYTVNALVRSGMNDEALELLERVYRDECDIQPTEAMWEVVTDAFSRIEDWETVEKIEQMRYPNLDPSELPSAHGKIFQHFTGLVKVGRGKNVYFEIATIDMPGSERMVVGVHPNRNPSKNGIQIEFYEEKKDGPMQRCKLGYVLVQSTGDKSCLLGMFLNGNLRGQGLSKICLAFWFKLCLSAEAKSTTGIINKPLLALLLEEKFHMSPIGGVEMELCPDPDVPGRVLLYAPTRKDLRGVFSPWDLKQQNLKLLQRPLRERGRMITVGGSFHAKTENEVELRKKVDEILPPETVQCKLQSISDYQNVLFGREL